jgi:hypothetical protein
MAMSPHEFRRAARRTCLVSALPLCILLSACGGGGGDSNVASIPPPPTTPPPPDLPQGTVTYVYPATDPVQIKTSWLDSPATRAGTSDLLGLLSINPGSGVADDLVHRITTPSEFTMTVGTPGDRGLDYTLNSPAGILPENMTTVRVFSPDISWDINPTVAYRYTNPYGDTPQYLGQRLTGQDALGAQLFSYDFTRGSTGTQTSLGSGNRLLTTLDYDIGDSYVAMGEWSWRVVDIDGSTVPGTESGQLLFVNGDRTPESGIPISGTATYDARSFALLSSSGTAGIPFTLTADFGQRTMSTLIDQDYRYAPARSSADDPILGIHVGGSAPFSNDGLFDIPLTGTANYAYNNSPTTPPTEPVTGMMDGAFFGPNAEQVGGVFALERPEGTLLVQDAFVGQQEPH